MLEIILIYVYFLAPAYPKHQNTKHTKYTRPWCMTLFQSAASVASPSAWTIPAACSRGGVALELDRLSTWIFPPVAGSFFVLFFKCSATLWCSGLRHASLHSVLRVPLSHRSFVNYHTAEAVAVAEVWMWRRIDLALTILQEV